MQARYWNWFFDSWRLDIRSNILAVWCDEYVMVHYNNDNNAYYRVVNAQKFETIEHNTVWISTFFYTRNPFSYSFFEMFICIYSVRGETDQLPTKYIPIYHLLRTKCLHFCLHIDWNPYSTFNKCNCFPYGEEKFDTVMDW